MKLSTRDATYQVSNERTAERSIVRTDRIDASAGAGVPSDGAAERGARLRRGVAHEVTRAAASTLEGVVEPNPVARLVRQRLPHWIHAEGCQGWA